MEPKTKVATLIGEQTSPAGAKQRIYRLDPPAKRRDWRAGEMVDVPRVVVSAAVVYGIPETYIFEADARGEITNWTEMDGSYRGDLDHAEALRRAGYAVADDVAEATP